MGREHVRREGLREAAGLVTLLGEMMSAKKSGSRRIMIPPCWFAYMTVDGPRATHRKCCIAAGEYSCE